MKGAVARCLRFVLLSHSSLWHRAGTRRSHVGNYIARILNWTKFVFSSTYVGRESIVRHEDNEES